MLLRMFFGVREPGPNHRVNEAIRLTREATVRTKLAARKLDRLGDDEYAKIIDGVKSAQFRHRVERNGDA